MGVVSFWCDCCGMG